MSLKYLFAFFGSSIPSLSTNLPSLKPPTEKSRDLNRGFGETRGSKVTDPSCQSLHGSWKMLVSKAGSSPLPLSAIFRWTMLIFGGCMNFFNPPPQKLRDSPSLAAFLPTISLQFGPPATRSAAILHAVATHGHFQSQQDLKMGPQTRVRLKESPMFSNHFEN